MLRVEDELKTTHALVVPLIERALKFEMIERIFVFKVGEQTYHITTTVFVLDSMKTVVVTRMSSSGSKHRATNRMNMKTEMEEVEEVPSSPKTEINNNNCNIKEEVEEEEEEEEKKKEQDVDQEEQIDSQLREIGVALRELSDQFSR